MSLLLSCLALATAAEVHRHLLPERVETAADRATWPIEDGRPVAPAEWTGGSRVAGTLGWRGAEPALRVEARGRDGAARGPWVPAEITFRQDGFAIFVADLGRWWDGAELRLGEATDRAVDEVAWEHLEPAWPDPGRLSRAAARGSRTPVLRSSLEAIGVVPREDWGARSTTCTSTEDDWYRMAIHHTAGNQTSGGTVQGAVQALQAYAMDSGEYCDIPYQFLVGYDGTLWEGRPLTYTSGATGGGNNDGNIAVCFLGCYHPSSCPNGAGDAVTESMIDGAHLLVQTLVSTDGIPSTEDSIRGHRDWPDNATACPGDWVYERLDDLRAPMDLWAGAFVDQSFPYASVEPLRLHTGDGVEGWIELENTGTTTWIPGSTNLATIPRDVASPFADPSWLSPTRPATVDREVPPGETGRFTFTLRGNQPGEAVQYFGLVEEWVTWFADAPYGGGPGDDLLAVHVVVTDAPADTGAPPAGDDTGAAPLADRGLPGAPVAMSEVAGCGCATSGPAPWGALALAALWTRRRRPA